MKAITTRYFGPTNFKGSRIKATTEGGNSVTLHYDDALNSDQNHAKAAKALCDKLGWRAEMIGGHLENGMAWVFEAHSPRINPTELREVA